MTRDSNKVLFDFLKHPNGPHHFIFDIDSTLVHVHTRNHSILVDFIAQPGIPEKYPEACAKFSTVEFLTSDWGLKDTLFRHGLNNKDDEFFSDLERHWKKNFFSNDFLHHDLPVKGSVDYVNRVLKEGHFVTYLTGRDVPNMLEGTQRTLKELGFPMEDQGVNLILKPNTSVSDEDFKKDAFETILQTGSNKFFFENEPLNLNMAATHFPEIKLVFIDTTHSKQATPPDSAVVINHFLLD